MHTQEIGTPTHFASTFFASAAIACFAYSVLALLLLHALRPDYAPVRHMISTTPLAATAGS
jgi:hypothetical protein